MNDLRLRQRFLEHGLLPAVINHGMRLGENFPRSALDDPGAGNLYRMGTHLEPGKTFVMQIARAETAPIAHLAPTGYKNIN